MKKVEKKNLIKLNKENQKASSERFIENFRKKEMEWKRLGKEKKE